ncbi:MAG: hypothetical protein JST75_02465 [Bacteroidetes bacterium]|nr:hypothetical protein [Bacteroidota bacterium]
MPEIPKPTFFSFETNRFRILFWIFFICALITGYIQALQNKDLTNETATSGIISLETSGSYQRDTAIISSWKTIIPIDSLNNNCAPVPQKNRLELATNNIFIDFFFIFFYTGFAILIIYWLQLSPGFTRLLMFSAVIAGIMDIIENIGMLRFVQYGFSNDKSSISETTAIVTSIASYIKFFILALLLLFMLVYVLILRKHGLKIISAIISRRGVQLYQYRVIFLGVIIFVLPMWILDQGQDLLVNSNTQDFGVICFLGIVMAAALLNWYLAKLFFEDEYIGPVYPFSEPDNQNPNEKKVSRFLGVATILLPAAAILNALKVTSIGYILDIFPPMAWLIALLTIFYTLIKYDFATRAYNALAEAKGKPWASAASFIVIILVGVIIPVVARLLLGPDKHKPSSLKYLYWNLILLAIAFYIFISIRSLIFTDGWLGKKIGKLVFVLTIIASVFFIWININPKVFVQWDNHFVTLPLLLAGLICYIFLFTILIRLSKWLKINFVLFIIVIGLVISALSTNNYHQVYLQPYSPRDSASQPLDLKNYFREWVLARKTEIDQDSIYPVFLVNTYGGGIRAAAFTSMAITFLDSAIIEKGKWKKGFQHYMFSISGASGGTIGAAIQCAYRNKHIDDASAYKQDSFYNFYRHDFLTAVLIPDLGRDIWASASSISKWDDRSAVQEKLWIEFGKKYLHFDAGVDFDSIWSRGNKSKNYEVPLLFSNTLNVDDGLKGICAPVHLSGDDFPATIFIRDRLDSINAHRNNKDSKDGISLMTGAFLSARFPFISPSGKMGPGFHFMDGGGKDNSGASTSELIFATLGRYVGNQKSDPSDSVFTALTKKIRFYFVSISNSPLKKEPRKLVENRFELISPLVGIINSGIDGNAHAADSTLRARYGMDTLLHLGFRTGYFSIYPTVDCIRDSASNDSYIPVLPLGWQISEPALLRLQASFGPQQVNNRVGADSIIKIIELEKNLKPVN